MAPLGAPAGLTKGQPFPGGGPVKLPRPGSLTKGQSGKGIIKLLPRPAGATPQSLGPAPQPGGQPPPGGAATPQAPPNPLDSTYFENVAANQFKANNSVNALNLQGSQAGTALQQALGQLSYQQPRQQLALEQRWNWGGHDIDSTPYAQAQGDLTNSFLGRQTAAQSKYGDTMSSIAQRIAAIRGGEPLYEDAQAEASAGRSARLAASSPAPPPPAAQSAPSGLAPAAQGLTKGQSGAGVIRTLPTPPRATGRDRLIRALAKGTSGQGVIRTIGRRK